MTLPLLFALATFAPNHGDDPAATDPFKPDPAWKALDESKSIWFDPSNKRLVVRAKVACREGFLEHLLCRENTKEHEAILASPALPRMIHAGLLLTGAKVGHPVKFRPKFEPPAGTSIAIALEWIEGGKTRKADAKTWIKDEKSGKTLLQDWVFAGSSTFEDPETKQTLYAADGGDVITVSNFPSALLDLPFASSADDANRSFVANDKNIPAKGTWVTMYLNPAKSPAPDAEAPNPPQR